VSDARHCEARRYEAQKRALNSRPIPVRSNIVAGNSDDNSCRNIIVRAPRGGAVAGAAVASPVIRLSLLIALVEVVKQEREWERDGPACLGLSWGYMNL